MFDLPELPACIRPQADVLRRAPRPEEIEVLHNPPHYSDMLPKKDAG